MSSRRNIPRRPNRGQVIPKRASAAVDTGLYAINALTTTKHYKTADPGGEAGQSVASGGFGGFVLFGVESQAVASDNRHIFSRYGTAGYFVRTTGTNSGLIMLCSNSVGGTAQTPAVTIAAGDVGKVLGFVFQVCAGPLIRAYYNRIEQGAGTSLGGEYGTPAGDLSTYFGYRASNTSVTDIKLFGAATWRGTPSLAQIQAYYDAVKTGADIQDSITGATMTNVWSVKRSQAGSAPASIANTVGANALSIVGAPGFVSVTSPTWGW